MRNRTPLLRGGAVLAAAAVALSLPAAPAMAIPASTLDNVTLTCTGSGAQRTVTATGTATIWTLSGTYYIEATEASSGLTWGTSQDTLTNPTTAGGSTAFTRSLQSPRWTDGAHTVNVYLMAVGSVNFLDAKSIQVTCPATPVITAHTTSATVYFTTDKAKLSRAAKAKLGAALTTASAGSITGVEVTGSVWGRKWHATNKKLAKARATAVVNYLKSKGVTATATYKASRKGTKAGAKEKRADLVISYTTSS